MRKGLEALLTAVAGVTALALPVLTGAPRRGYDAAFIPFLRDVVEGVQDSSLALLFGVGGAAGFFGTAPVFLLGVSSVLILPIWSAVDLGMGGEGHNLLPIEWFIHGVYALIGTAGAATGRAAALRRKRRSSSAGSTGAG